MMKLVKFCVSLMISLIFLTMFVFVYGYGGRKVSTITKETDYHYQANQIKTNSKEGFFYAKMDENGYNNQSVINDIDVLVMGSSHMEALQIRTDENTTAILAEATGLSAYNIGISGHTIFRCVDNYCHAITTFHPNRLSIMETDTVSLDKDNMQRVVNGSAIRLSAHDSILIDSLQAVIPLRPIFRQLKLWISQNSMGGGTTRFETSLPEGYADILHSFLSIVADSAKESNIKPIIFYQPPEQLNSDGTVTYKTNPLYLDCFDSTCKDLGIVFVDMTDSFNDLYATEHQLAHGFINTAVGSGHLNKYGHRVIAEKLAEVIQGLEAE